MKHKQSKTKSLKTPDLHGAILYALGFGLVAALIWFGVVVLTGFELGIIAVGVGYAVGYGVFLGSKKHTGLQLQLLAAGLSLVAILVGEYLITNHFLYEYLVSIGEPTYYFLNFLPVLKETFLFFGDSPISLIFVLIAAYVGFTVPRDKEQVKAKK